MGSIATPTRRERMARSAHELGLPDSAPLVGAVGNIRVPKAYDVLLRAFALVRAAVPEARLVIVGQPLAGLYEDLLELRRSLGMEAAVHFLGFREDVPRDSQGPGRVRPFVQRRGVLVGHGPRRWRRACPVVATRSGRPGDHRGGRHIGDSRSAGGRHRPGEGYHGCDRRPRSWGSDGRCGRERVLRDFSLRRMVERYAELYEELSSGR